MATARICSIPDCSKPHYGLGWCRNHWRRYNEHGDPLAGKLERGVVGAWLREHAGYKGEDCLKWPFGGNAKGYGACRYQGKPVGAHHAMCLLAHGRRPSKVHEAAHSCGNGHLGCVNPKHLRWATPAENVADAVAHGSLRGTKHAKAKLTEDQVRQIRSMEGTMSRRLIGLQFGISLEAVASIHKQRSWGWLP